MTTDILFDTPIKRSLLSKNRPDSVKTACDLFLGLTKEQTLEFLHDSKVLDFINRDCSAHPFAILYYIMGRHGISMHHYNKDGLTLLHQALLFGNDKIVQYLIENGAKTSLCVKRDNKEHGGCTAMHIAAKIGNVNVIECLKKSNINKYDVSGFTPLHYAVKNGHIQCVKYLIENGAKIDHAVKIRNEEYGGCTAIHIAVKSKHVNVFSYLVEKDKSIADVKDQNGFSSVDYLKQKHNHQMMEILIKKKASFDVFIAIIVMVSNRKTYVEKVTSIVETTASQSPGIYV